MYGVIQDTIFDGTLRDRWQALVTFMAMIVLADADDNVDMTTAALASRTGLPLGVITEGIEVLEKPDEFSRSPGDDGRRITRLDDHRPWGWHIVNRDRYKKLRRSEDRRDYFREYRRSQRIAAKQCHTSSPSVHTSSPQAVGSRQETVGRRKEPKTIVAPLALPAGFEEFWALYPRHENKAKALSSWKRLSPDAELQAVILAGIKRLRETQKWRDGFVTHPTTFLNGRRWEDEPMENGTDDNRAKIDAWVKGGSDATG